jgi:hypothetical protein
MKFIHKNIEIGNKLNGLKNNIRKAVLWLGMGKFPTIFLTLHIF